MAWRADLEVASRAAEGSAELANLEGVDVLLEGNSFAAVHGPHVDHLHSGGFSGTLVLPRVAPERHDCVTVAKLA
jgi:hypothetical protein